MGNGFFSKIFDKTDAWDMDPNRGGKKVMIQQEDGSFKAVPKEELEQKPKPKPKPKFKCTRCGQNEIQAAHVKCPRSPCPMKEINPEGEHQGLVENTFELCDVIAKRSRDPSTKVGCVILRPNKTLVSAGYNGFPRGVDDLNERYDDRPTKYKFTCHAEANAIVTAREPLDECILYSSMMPCNECAKLIIQAGIKEVHTNEIPKAMVERWAESYAVSKTMFQEAGVKCLFHPNYQATK